MDQRVPWFVRLLFLSLFVSGCAGGDEGGNGHPIAAAPATFPNTASQLVLGQGSFTTSDVNFVDGQGLNFPRWVAVDSSGRLYVSDTDNNRILGYANASAFANGDAAVVVLGQVDFNSNRANQGGNGPTASTLWQPEGVAVDSNGNLYVADRNNNRVLRYDAPITTNGQAANLVLGQADLANTADRVNNRCNQTASGSTPVAPPTASTLCFPEGVALDSSGNLYVSDKGNHRVVRYTAPSTNGQAATLVLGQADLTTGAGCNRAGVPPNLDSVGVFPNPPAAPHTLCGPTGLALDSTGRLYVADEGNHRVLRYNTPIVTNQSAALVLGQGDFVSNSCPAAAATTLCGPEGVVLDSADNLYVADRGNNRVLRYNAPLATGQAAAFVLGPSIFGATRDCNQGNVNAPTSTSLCDPVGVTRDGSNNLYVADRGNNRVLRYAPITANSQAAVAVLGQGQGTGAAPFTRNGVNFVDGKGVNLPRWVAIDSSGRLYLADLLNHRVLRFDPPFSDAGGDNIADLVLGQATFNDNRCNQGLSASTSSTLCFPEGVAVDGSGNLYVADAGNNRVLRYDAPITTNGQAANLVLGQTGFTTRQCNQGLADPTASTLCTPVGVAVEVDSSGVLLNLYVADTGNSRVVRYSAAPLDGVGDSFVGQANSTGGKCNRFVSLPLPSPAANTLCRPEGVTVDSSGNLYVADAVNNRVLRYTVSITTNQSASIVLGQTGFTSGLCNQGGATATDATLCVPGGITLDSSGRLYVSDQTNHRIVRYHPPFTTGGAADLIIGQREVDVPGVGLATTVGCNRGDPLPSASTLCTPMGLATEGLALFAADTSNNRVLTFIP